MARQTRRRPAIDRPVVFLVENRCLLPERSFGVERSHHANGILEDIRKVFGRVGPYGKAVIREELRMGSELEPDLG